MKPQIGKAPRGDPHEAFLAVERFLKTSQIPVLMEPGEDPLPLIPDHFALECRSGIIRLECWSETRNLVRRLRGNLAERRGRLELEVERFGGRPGSVTLVDLANPANREMDRRGSRLKYRERLRRSLRRQFPDWSIVELTTEPDLHNTLSPSFPRALLRKGTIGLAAIGAPEDSPSPEAALGFGLIWLDYLRRRERSLAIEGLAVFVPAGSERTTCHRVRYLNPAVARFTVFAQDRGDGEAAVNPQDYTNFDTRIEVCRRPLAQSRLELAAWVGRIAAVNGVERCYRPDGSVSLAIHGLEFARATGEELFFGIDEKHPAGCGAHVAEIVQLAQGLARMRHAAAADRTNPLYTRRPEAWLESQVRLHLEQLEATLLPEPVYGQVPQFAAGDRGVIDLLAVDRDGRLTVIEVKADPDIHLPLQALDYWMRVKWHLDRDEFSGRGYFPGVPISRTAPRLLLVAPALEYHPSNETVLRYFSPAIAVERLGVGLEWRRALKIMFRVPPVLCPSLSFARSNKL